MSTTYKYAYGLLNSGRAFVESAVDHAREGGQEQWKFAVLHLTIALELLLKARLAIKDPKHLVSGKSTKVTDQQFDLGDFHSVGIDECIEKLDRIFGITLDRKQREVIDRLRALRNRIVHYINPSSNELKAVVGAGLNLFIEINDAEFRNEDPYGAKTMSQLVVELHKYNDFVKDRLAYLSDQLRSHLRPRTHHTDECSYCLQDATVIDGDNIRCLFCNHDVAIEEFAKIISDNRLVEACPDCGRHAVAQHQWKDGEPTYECFCCGYFRGPELKWRDWNGADTSRLHPLHR